MVVTHSTGFAKPNYQELLEENLIQFFHWKLSQTL